MGRHSAQAPATPSGDDPDGEAAGSYSDEYENLLVGRGAAPVRARSRNRVGFAVGLVLLGVILLVFGLITLTTDPDPPTTAGQDSSVTATTLVASTPALSLQPTLSPSATSEPPAQTSAAPPSQEVLPVTVLNNSAMSGLASRVAVELEAGGWPIAELLNYSETQVPVTTVFFTPGKPMEKAAAQALAAQFPGITGGAKPRFDGLDGSGLTVAAVGDWVP
ncbi:MAG: LytR C-terminal domain-containing protein [Geodermatophilaceae bacterium]